MLVEQSPPEVKVYDAPDYRLDDESSRKTVAWFAPKGEVYVVIRQEGEEWRVRLYAAKDGKLNRFDQCLGRAVVEALDRKTRSYWFSKGEGVRYFGWDRTDGSKTSGLRFVPTPNVNTVAGIVYDLAEIIHGDRKAWSFRVL
jgi:hypothetical protein